MARDSIRVLEKLQEQRAKYMYMIKTPNVPFRLSTYGLSSNSFSCTYDVRLHIVGVQKPNVLKLLRELQAKGKIIIVMYLISQAMVNSWKARTSGRGFAFGQIETNRRT